jgi:hypothetical protein
MIAQCLIAETEEGTWDRLWEGDCFATMPELTAIKFDQPAMQPFDEEELHTSFEQAISDRLLIVGRQLDSISGPLHNSRPLFTTNLLNQCAAPATSSKQPVKPRRFTFAVNSWQRAIIISSLTLLSMMAGFDIMGLLMLHLH